MTLRAEPADCWWPAASLEPNQVQDIVRLILPTVPRYQDAASRQAVLAVVSALLARDNAAGTADETANAAATTNGKPASALSTGLIKWLESETGKVEKSGATSTRLALLGWAATIYASVPAEHPLDDAPFLSLATSLSSLLNVVLDDSAGAKETVRKSALVVTRRAVRTVSVSGDAIYARKSSLLPRSDLTARSRPLTAPRSYPAPRTDLDICESGPNIPPRAAHRFGYRRCPPPARPQGQERRRQRLR